MGNLAPPSGLMVALCLRRVQPRRLRRGCFIGNLVSGGGNVFVRVLRLRLGWTSTEPADTPVVRILRFHFSEEKQL